MQIKNTKQILSVSLSVLASVLLVGAFVYGATTIGANISTGGTLSVTGDASLSNASTTDNFWLGNQTANDDDYLYMDASSSESLMWDDDPGQFALSDDLQITGNASVTEAFIVGSDDQTDNDIIYFDGRTENLTWNNSLAEFDLTDDLEITGNASVTEAFIVGSDDQTDNDIIYFDGRIENLTWNNSASEFTMSDDLHLDGQYVSSTNMMIDSWATTTHMWIGATNSANATSVMVLGDNINTNSSVCIKIRTTADEWVYAYATSSSSLVAQGLKWTATSCE